MNGYTNPDVLVSTDWVAEHTSDPGVRIVESDEDVLLYESGHIPGAVKVDWHTDLNDSRVHNCDGSWTEWGNAVAVPIANPSLLGVHG